MKKKKQASPPLTVPVLADWGTGPFKGDLAYAFKNFNGKTLGEAVELLKEDSLRYQEDFFYMPSRVFHFYVRAYISYLLSEASQRDSDSASCFIRLILHRIKWDMADIRPLWEVIRPAVDRIATEPSFYEINPKFHPRIRRRCKTIRDAMDLAAGTQPAP